MIYQLLNLVISIVSRIISVLKSYFTSGSDSDTIVFDNGISVEREGKIAEGGFSYIYAASDSSFPGEKYALKRIVCPDKEIIVACKNEAKVHQTLGNKNTNLLPLISLKFDSSGPQTVCYMLFPLITGGSLRDEISKRLLLRDDVIESDRRPFTEKQILRIFKGVLRGVMAIHDSGLAHRDIKLENVLMDKQVGMGGDEENYLPSGPGTRILMDFGSVRPLTINLSSRRVVLDLADDAARNSTVSYRAPELFEGGCRHGINEPDINGKVDVWSCGCFLYAMMYGASPFEMEFHNGTPRIVECTYLRVLSGKVPCPPNSSEVGLRFSQELAELVSWILNVDRVARPDIYAVIGRVDNLLASDDFVAMNRGAMREFV